MTASDLAASDLAASGGLLLTGLRLVPGFNPLQGLGDLEEEGADFVKAAVGDGIPLKAVVLWVHLKDGDRLLQQCVEILELDVEAVNLETLLGIRDRRFEMEQRALKISQGPVDLLS